MQKFKRGDVVHIQQNLGSWMSHFTSGVDAVILGSYRDQYGGGPDNERSYTVLFFDGGECSWYYDNQMTLVRPGGEAEIDAIEQQRREKDARDSDLNWIVANWARIRNRPPTASILALAALAGYSKDDLWGKHGEGIDYYANTMQIFAAFDPVLTTGDIEAVRQCGRSLKIQVQSHNLSRA